MTFVRKRAAWARWVVGAFVAATLGAIVSACGNAGLNDGADNSSLDGSSAPCANPTNTGCPCDTAGQSVDCGYVKEQSGNFVTCAEGSRTCTGGQWGACVATHTTFQSTETLGGGGVTLQTLGQNSDAGEAGIAGQTNCAAQPCDPACQTFVDTSNGVDSGTAGVVPTDAGGWTLPGNGVTLDASTLCFVTLTGTVYDPASLNPVPNALVAIPFAGTPPGSGTPPTLPTGVPLSDACGGTAFSALRAALTKSDGTFSLPGVPTQGVVTVVVQIGRWRRLVTVNTSSCLCGSTINITTPSAGSCISNVSSCNGATDGYANTANCLTRLPRKQSEGNIPHIAIATGGLDPEECTLYRMGVDSSEFTDENGAGRVHMFINSANGSGGSTLPSPAANHDVSYLLGFTCSNSGCAGTSTSPSTSGIQNPDFETGNLTGYTTTGSPVAVNATAPYTGTYSAQVGDSSKKKQGTQTLTQANMVAPANAQSFQFAVLRKCGGGNGDDFYPTLTDNTNGTTWTWSTSCRNTNNWRIYVANGPIVAGDKFTLTVTNDNPANDVSYTVVDGLQWNVTSAAQSLLNNYDLVMLPCNGGPEYYSTSWDTNFGDNKDDPGRQNLVNYTNIGGRLFTSHWGREWIERTTTTFPNGPFPNVANWLSVSRDFRGRPTEACAPYATSGNNCNEADPTTGYYNTGAASPRPGNLASWMGTVTANSSTLSISGARYDVTSVTSASVDFVEANSDNNGETTHDVVQDFTFDTPLGSANQLGRVMYTDMHLASGQTSGNFPGNCPAQGTALTAQEDAAEFLLFDLGNCVTGQPVPGSVPGFITTGDGTNSTCSGGSSNDNKIEPSSCTTNADCEMDFHCAAGSCIWSGNIGYSDAICTDSNGNPAVDLTIGVPCANGIHYDIPICNRGTGTLAAGSVLKIENSGNGGNPSAPWNCAGPPTPNPPSVSAGSATCSYTTPFPLGPGQCLDIDTSTVQGAACEVLEVGERFLYLNYDQSIPECGTGFSGTGPGCMNNTTHTKTTGSGCAPTCGGTPFKAGTFTRDFDGVCPSGYVPVWHLFTWAGLTPSTTNLDFKAYTADTQAQLGVQFATAATLESPAPDSAATGYVDGQKYSTDVDTKLLASGYPGSGTPVHGSHEWLRIVMTLNPNANGTQAPTLLSWNQSYDCVAAQ